MQVFVFAKYILVTWQPPSEPNGVITNYRVGTETYTGSQPTEVTVNMEETGVEARRKLLRDLVPETNYVVEMQAATSKGWGTSFRKTEKTVAWAGTIDHFQLNGGRGSSILGSDAGSSLCCFVLFCFICFFFSAQFPICFFVLPALIFLETLDSRRLKDCIKRLISLFILCLLYSRVAPAKPEKPTVEGSAVDEVRVDYKFGLGGGYTHQFLVMFRKKSKCFHW